MTAWRGLIAFIMISACIGPISHADIIIASYIDGACEKEMT